MNTLVHKYGGTSVADLDHIKQAAKLVQLDYKQGNNLVVVVSAMAGQTDHLDKQARAFSGEAFGNETFSDETFGSEAFANEAGGDSSDTGTLPEYDAVVSTGEQVTAGLMALALQSIGVPARSVMGWQAPIHTDSSFSRARIQRVELGLLRNILRQKIVAVVPGFQGIQSKGRITTLGRGGSDTTAVALAVALKASRCLIYTDVSGVYTADPRIVAKARKLAKITYEEMLELASLGSKVLHHRSVELAMKNGLELEVHLAPSSSPNNRTHNNSGNNSGNKANQKSAPTQKSDSSQKSEQAAMPKSTDQPTHQPTHTKGTLITMKDKMEAAVVRGISHDLKEAKITLMGVADKPGVAALVFGSLSDVNLNVDMIVQNISEDGTSTDLTFTVAAVDADAAKKCLVANKSLLKYQKLVMDKNVAKISIVGTGMRSAAGVASKMFKTLAKQKINIQVISTSEIKISVLIDKSQHKQALVSLHDAFIK